MKLVFTETHINHGAKHEAERKYLPPECEVATANYYEDGKGDNSEFFRLIEEADMIINSYVYFGKELIDHLKKCKVISFQSTGFNEVDLEYATQKGIAVTSILDYCTEETAENAIATMMCLQRGTLGYNRSVQEDKLWYYNAVPLHMLRRVEGQTMGIIGLGRIGRAVAKRAKGLGMTVIAYDPYLPAEIADEAGVPLVELDEIFQTADVISIHMSLGDDNVHFLDKEAFKKMKKQPLIINEGRGPMISEADLAWALDEGLVRGAGLDMLENENPDKEYLARCPLLGRSNVIINPHSGYRSTTSDELIRKIPVDNALACYEGRYNDAWVMRNKLS